ncbi:hypothetical protein AVEN_195659-1 [Araneus ventricosus]|uniref:Uncharacterized protein n=1 Tax=Araneus ventricosus TaxID=182803 RepID=A0A4Y2BBF5_ARAVE|nr:hypothetical protein AVEN_195659-1 [Araneus ventricosus]
MVFAASSKFSKFRLKFLQGNNGGGSALFFLRLVQQHWNLAVSFSSASKCLINKFRSWKSATALVYVHTKRCGMMLTLDNGRLNFRLPSALLLGKRSVHLLLRKVC